MNLKNKKVKRLKQKKIGNEIFKNFYCCFFLSFTAIAQVQFEAKVSKDKLGLNERLRIDFEMNENGDNFVPPSFSNFNVVGGPSRLLILGLMA